MADDTINIEVDLDLGVGDKADIHFDFYGEKEKSRTDVPRDKIGEKIDKEIQLERINEAYTEMHTDGSL